MPEMWVFYPTEEVVMGLRKRMRRRLKQLVLLPVLPVGGLGFALMLVYLSYRAADPVQDPIHPQED